MNYLGNLLTVVSRRSDLLVGVLVLVAVAMMIVPLPTPLVDVLITINIGVSVVILLTGLYISRPIEFSSLPSVILIATLFRLAITITTSRLILLQADAGEIVSAFGAFVIGGNITVGLVVFLIITVAQFVVITKGSERVAEVAARFSLDALPGKQMSIDSDLRNGDIDQAEARRLRRGLERESHLYGALDGAAKFVKGDAIASLVVIMVNLIGGISVGTLQHGLALGDAAQTYSLLTVGDGLVAQIPALLVSVAAGTVVTRVASDEMRDLGGEITSQLVSNPRVLGLAALILFGLAFLPGFPTAAFLTLAAILGGASYWVGRHRPATSTAIVAATGARATGTGALPPSASAPAIGTTAAESLPPRGRLIVWLGPALATAVPAAAFQAAAERARRNLFSDLGVATSPAQLSVDSASGPDSFRIDLDGVPVAEGSIAPDGLMVEAETFQLDLLAIPHREGTPITKRERTIWVAREHEAALAEAGIAALAPPDALARYLAQVLRAYATHFVGLQETRTLLAAAENEAADLVKEAQSALPLQKFAEVMRRLVEEDVPVRNMRLILEAVIEWGKREQDPALLVEYVRIALRRQICFRCADRNRVIAAYLMSRSLEDLIRSAVRPTAVGSFVSISEATVRPALEQIKRMIAASAADARPAILTSMDIRRHMRALLVRNELDLPVLSYQELAPEFSLQALATITGEARDEAEIGKSTMELENAAGH
ncbi:MAG: type III secretion system export apparatus subunit SctV [Bradyrhizobium sp.]|nr:type III secretion system export apparatus subunit SctV [Bradyrhizobium sp.]